jgi:hypothetical protein
MEKRGIFEGVGKSRQLRFDGIKTYDANIRRNLVTIENLMTPGITEHQSFEHPDFDILVDRIAKARKNGRPVIWSMGAHVIKNRLSRYIIEMIKNKTITHIASNGAGSIHDFELAYLGNAIACICFIKVST